MYTQTTQAAFLAMLGERLGDPTNIYWALPELRLYLAEALHTWQALTSWYRTNLPLATTPGQPWYDLSAAATPPATTPLPYLATDSSLIAQMLYHLLEPQLGAGNTWVGTEQFDLPTIETSVQNALNRFLSDSGVVSTLLTVPFASAPPNGLAAIPATIIDLLRVAWEVSGATNWGVLWRSNEWEIHAFASLASSVIPLVYADSAVPPNTIRLAPPPTVGGQLEIAAVVSGAVLNLPAAPTVLGIPEDYVWGVKFAALADLLGKDGEAKDITRAQYCETRYQESVELAKRFPSLLQLNVNAAPLWVGSVIDLDAFSPGWENATGTTGPQMAGMIGRNLLALTPPPTSATSITLDLAANMPIPISDSDILQIPPDVLGPLLDYSVHLAAFKMGGSEFLMTEEKRQTFYRTAAQYNARLRQMNFFNDALRSPAFTQKAVEPRIDVPVLTAYAPPGNANG